jgi:uncharacterized peroxidase-related enzyme
MSRLPTVDEAQLDPEIQSILAAGEEIMGFSANDALLMAHHPALLKAMLALVQAVYSPGRVPLALKKLVAVMTSAAAGCQYCEAHTQYGAMNEGVAAQKVAAIWDYQNSELFTDAERAALDVARAAAFSPNETSDENFERLKQHYSTEQIIEIVGVISMFGFLNRWNSTLATDLEQTPKAAVQASGIL